MFHGRKFVFDKQLLEFGILHVIGVLKHHNDREHKQSMVLQTYMCV